MEGKFSALIIIALLLSLLAACSAYDSKNIVLTTDIPALAAYIEYYNAVQEDYKIKLHYQEQIPQSLARKQDRSDLVIARGLSTTSLRPHFQSLASLLKEEKIQPMSIYAPLLETGYFKNKPVLLPLSFSLPLVIFHRKYENEEIPSVILPLEILKKNSLAFHPKKSSRFGFSPFWNEEFLYTTAIMQGALFKYNQESGLYWNKPALADTVTFFQEWIKEVQGGYEAEQLFSNKYMSIPPDRLIAQEKILYYFSDSEYLFSIPKEKRKNIEFRWLSLENKIPVTENTVYIGIPKNSKNSKGARAFILWLFNPALQEKLLEINNFKRIPDIFGLAGQFSSLIEVNEKYIPKHYPMLVGHIPSPDLLLFPGQKPDGWQQVKADTLNPWLKESVLNPDTEKKLEDLLNFSP